MDELANSTNTNVLIYEYVGYSLSRLEGAIPTEAGCYRCVPPHGGREELSLSCMPPPRVEHACMRGAIGYQ